MSPTNLSSIQVGLPSLLLASLEGASLQVSTLSGRGSGEPDFPGRLGSEFIEPGIYWFRDSLETTTKGRFGNLIDINLYEEKICLAKLNGSNIFS